MNENSIFSNVYDKRDPYFVYPRLTEQPLTISNLALNKLSDTSDRLKAVCIYVYLNNFQVLQNLLNRLVMGRRLSMSPTHLNPNLKPPSESEYVLIN